MNNIKTALKVRICKSCGLKFISGSCSSCKNKKRMERYYKNRDKELAANKMWHRNNRDKHRARSKRWKDKNPDKVHEIGKRWRMANKAIHLNSVKKWKDKNPERIKIIHRINVATLNLIKKGKLKRSAECESCHARDVAIEAAHYNYEDAGRVRWLCRRCHRRWDKEEPKSKIPAN